MDWYVAGACVAGILIVILFPPGRSRVNALIWHLPPWVHVLVYVLTGYVLYANTTNVYVSTSALLTMLGIFLLIEMVIGIWSLVVLLKCLGEVHGFSAWRALGAVLLTGAMMYVVNMILSSRMTCAWIGGGTLVKSLSPPCTCRETMLAGGSPCGGVNSTSSRSFLVTFASMLGWPEKKTSRFN